MYLSKSNFIFFLLRSPKWPGEGDEKTYAQVHITRPSLNKLPICAAIGVPEIWRYDGHTVTPVILQEGAYVAREESVAFPRLTRQVLSRFMEESKQQERTAWLRSVRAWARQLSVGEA
jgi:hypothetical protein